jgi:hypothetical protein
VGISPPNGDVIPRSNGTMNKRFDRPRNPEYKLVESLSTRISQTKPLITISASTAKPTKSEVQNPATSIYLTSINNVNTHTAMMKLARTSAISRVSRPAFQRVARLQPIQTRFASTEPGSKDSVGDKGTAKVYNQDGTNPNKNLMYVFPLPKSEA